MTKITLALTFFVLCFFGAFYCTLEAKFENPYPGICKFVFNKIYRTDQETENWKILCLSRSHLVKPWSSKALIIQDISNVLQILKMSHLEIFEPRQAQNIWHGVSQETGIESEYVDGQLVIFKVHLGSPAAEAGLRFGDVIVSLNNEYTNPWRVNDTAGDLIFLRQGKEIKIQITTRKIKRTELVEVKKLHAQVWQVRVPSFRREFFERNPLETYFSELQKSSLIVIDLRGNKGGNFVAGLRFLSNFICDVQEVGRLVRPRDLEKTSAVIPEDLDDLNQLAALDTVHSLILKTYPQKKCLTAEIKVLIDSKTASVAELVAQGLKEKRGAQLLGSTSSGQLLVGVWYPMDELGQGVQMSIPEALYESLGGRRIEGRGVELDKVLYYNLDEMQKGRDPWIEMILKERK